MDTLNSTAAGSFPPEPANYDEASMQQSMLFSDSLKDLENLRKQLYTAAEYFELSYTNEEKKQIVVNTLKDYAVKALVNTVDHLGSATYKVTDMLDEKVGEVTGTELRVSCIEQRLRTCQEYIDCEGHAQQSLNIETPKYHRRYILPVGETMLHANHAKANYLHRKLDVVEDWHQFKNAVRATIKETAPPSTVRNFRSASPMPQPTQQRGKVLHSATMPEKDLEKRTVSPHRFPLFRSGSFSSRPTTPKTSRSTTSYFSRSTTPNPSFGRHQLSQPQKSASMRFPERANPKEVDQIPSKSKRLLKALLSRRKSKKDETLYTYLDEYT